METIDAVRSEIDHATVIHPRRRSARTLSPDAKVIALATEFSVVGVKLREYNRSSPSDAVFDEALHRGNAILNKLVTARATTIAGCRAKARAVDGAALLDRGAELAASLVRDMIAPALASDERAEAKMLRVATDYGEARDDRTAGNGPSAQ